MKNIGKNIVLWVIIALLVVGLFNLFQGSGRNGNEQQLAFSDFLAQVESGQVSEVTIQGNDIQGRLQNQVPFKTYAPDDPQLVQRLTDQGV